MTSRPRISSTRRSFVAGTAAAAASTFFIGRAKAADEIIMKLATVAPAGTPWADQLTKLKKHIKEATGGRVKVKAHLGGALGDENATAEATKRGTIQCFGGSIGALASAVPELECIELPYLFPDAKSADRVLDEVIRADLDKLLWDRGYKLFFFSENGYRSIGSTFEIKSISDLKGKKMRSQESKSHLDFWKAVGASPVPISVTEVLSSLQTGVVDGFDNTPLFAFAASWYQGVKHFTLTEHIYQPGVVVYSRKFWESLPADLQTILSAEPEKLAKQGRRGVRAMGGQLIENFRTAGITVNSLSATEKATFAATAGVAYASFLKRASPSAAALLKKIQDAL
ncbi:MAG: TRAP transporter substrate-binding protein [Deltaproteobacteria bacterium]|nr:TRAP transporter substrate-binding protein [Nannocystaceae bacterium]